MIFTFSATEKLHLINYSFLYFRWQTFWTVVSYFSSLLRFVQCLYMDITYHIRLIIPYNKIILQEEYLMCSDNSVDYSVSKLSLCKSLCVKVYTHIDNTHGKLAKSIRFSWRPKKIIIKKSFESIKPTDFILFGGAAVLALKV